MNFGFIKLHRRILEWEWVNDPATFCLFMHLLLKANFENKKWRGVEIKRGEILTGRLELVKSTGLSERQVRTSLQRLKTTNELTIKTTNRFSIITLTNYSLYQDSQKENDQLNDQLLDQQTTNKRPTKDQQTTTTKEIKEIKEIKERQEIKENNLFNYDFDDFWNHYTPIEDKNGQSVGKGSKADSKKSYEKARKIFSHKQIMSCLEVYLKDCAKNSRFTKHAVSWLNQAIRDKFEFEQTAVVKSQIQPQKMMTKDQLQEQADQERYKRIIEKHENNEGAN